MQDCKIKYPLKFYPLLKQTLWGGNRIIPFLSLENEVDCEGVPYGGLGNIGEYWAVSAIDGFESVVSNGKLKGLSLSDVSDSFREALLGKKNYMKFKDKFPLLVKFIDAAQDLSVQVHPNDKLAQIRHNCSGKTEMWYVLDANSQAKLMSGFKDNITAEQYNRMTVHEVVGALQRYDVASGDMFYLPAGTVHSIGAGAFIAEIQQTSDITYRIYDFDRRDKSGNFRELHTELAAEAIDYSFGGSCKIDYSIPCSNSSDAWRHTFEAVSCEHFSTGVISLVNGNAGSGGSSEYSFNYAALDSFVIITCVKGSCRIIYDNGNEMPLKRGDVVLLPADLKEVSIKVDDSAECVLLETHI